MQVIMHLIELEIASEFRGGNVVISKTSRGIG
jgi:hypothetical protein